MGVKLPPGYGPPRPAPAQDPLVRYVLRPLALAIMAACVAWPLAQVAVAFAPDAHPWLIVGACTLAALEASYAHSLIRARYLSGSELFRFRVIEYGLYFVAIRLGQLALAGWPDALTRGLISADSEALLALLFDVETLLVLLLAILVNFMASESLNDLDKAEEPPDRDIRPDKDAASPADNLTGRFFVVGAVLLILSGLARVSVRDLLNLERAPVSGLVLNVLIYFVLGLVLLGRVRLAQLSGRWQVQGVRTPPELPGRWVRYSLAFVTLAALLAFILPTGYTSGALGVIGDAILFVMTALWVIMAGLIALLVLPIAWLMSRMFGSSAVEPIEQLQQQILPPSDPAQVSSWLEVLRPFVIWTLVIGMVIYVVVSYLRERPEIMAALRRLAPLRALGRLWAALRQQVSGLLAVAEQYSPLNWLRERLARTGPRRMGFFRLGGAAPREQVIYYYLSLVRRAGEIGIRRRPAQTPREYEPRLASELPEVEPELAALTDAFIEARYSPQPVDAAAPSQARALWARLRAALRDRKVNDERGRAAK
jgi:hypothetical protein